MEFHVNVILRNCPFGLFNNDDEIAWWLSTKFSLKKQSFTKRLLACESYYDTK